LQKLSPIPKGSLIFAPMEGVTDEAFRKTILKLYPEWDYLATDFLRVPSAGRYPTKHLIRHFGKELSELDWVRNKTMFQILTSHKAFTIQMVKDIETLQYPWLDINLGCPSNTVTKNGGGSSLLLDLATLKPLVKNIRENFKGRLTAKIRTGFHDTSGFEDSIRLLNDEGIELITVHGRTRDMMYKVPAVWEYIEKAVKISSVPIVGNGDIWSSDDVDRMLEQTGCHAVMIARGALKAPWIAQSYKNGQYKETSEVRLAKVKEFFLEYRAQLEVEFISDRGLLKQSKSISRYMFDGMDNSELTRRRLLLSQTAPDFYAILRSL
jgi:tRNA-dihydrouridine synthase B